ncbi:MAG: hypothetical protein K1X44_06955 [Alphaproteobacteria bacterium]|nr:hypothetical protein [Alphaproteobacteria bacterium]
MSSLLLAGCTQYWTKPNTNRQETAKDLSDCRIQANQGNAKIYTAEQLETPCMVGKGYNLSYNPPKQ